MMYSVWFPLGSQV